MCVIKYFVCEIAFFQHFDYGSLCSYFKYICHFSFTSCDLLWHWAICGDHIRCTAAQYGYTALNLAAELGHTDCVRLLVESGASCEAKIMSVLCTVSIVIDRQFYDCVCRVLRSRMWCVCFIVPRINVWLCVSVRFRHSIGAWLVCRLFPYVFILAHCNTILCIIFRTPCLCWVHFLVFLIGVDGRFSNTERTHCTVSCDCEWPRRLCARACGRRSRY